MKSISVYLLAIICLFGCNQSTTEKMEIEESQSYSFLVGTYPENPSQGIYKLEFSPTENTLKGTLLLDSIQNPSFVLAKSDNSRFFSVEEIASEQGGNVVMLGGSGYPLETLFTAPTVGSAPCYLALSKDEKWLVVGNYTGGNFSVFSAERDSLRLVQTLSHSGKSVNTARQEAPHVHSTVFSPNGKYLMVADLGTDKIYQYEFNPSEEKPLELKRELNMEPGDGPRHSVFSPSGEDYVVLLELTGAINIYSFDGDEFAFKQRESIVEEDFTGEHGAAEIRFSPEGQYLYTSNRGDDNSIAVFSKNGNGDYERIQIIKSGGIKPRNFIITRDGEYLLSAHETSNDIIVFKRDTKTGLLSQSDLRTQINSPVYLFETTSY